MCDITENRPDRKTPRNHGHATIKDKPVPVILTIGTLVKLIIAVMGPFLVIVSAALFWYHATNQHMDNEVIHLGQNERAILETKPEAKAARKEMVQEIAKHVGVKVREVTDAQKIGISNLKRELVAERAAERAARRTARTRLISEVRRAGRNNH